MPTKGDIQAKLRDDKVPELDRTIKNARGRALTAARKLIVNAINDAAPLGLREMGKESPFRKLKGSWRETGRTTDTVEVGTTNPVALWVTFGTLPHEERPKHRKAIAWPEGGHPVSHVTVSAKENPYVQVAVNAVQGAVAEAVAEIMRDAIEG